ncbi:MAG: sugar ABC transporter permease, partial [Candidatus Saccharibacteria bacterium]|nr:sugar ABC transporter permease [Pseudorhodobacter sp.]
MADQPTLDRSDTRVQHDDSLMGALREFLIRVRSGDLGMLPVVVGLVLISVVFSALNPIFLAPNNLVNLLFDCATVGVISLGIVCVLMLGEIDLSVGSMSGLASALVGVLWVNSGLPVGLAIIAAMIVGAAVGSVYAFLFNRLGMPSFISTLSGLLAILGLQLYILGPTGSINLPFSSTLVGFGQLWILPHWLSHLLALLPGVVMIWTGLSVMRRRVAANLSAQPVGRLVLKAAMLTAALQFAVWYLNLGRGVPLMFALFVALVVALNYALTRTQWGRSMFAVGGNREAARRSGINVKR